MVAPFDSLAQENRPKPDSLLSKSDSLILTKKITFNISDSAKRKITNSSDSLAKQTQHAFDSLRPDFKKFTFGLDSTKKKLKQRIDSLNKHGLPHHQYTKALDS